MRGYMGCSFVVVAGLLLIKRVNFISVYRGMGGAGYLPILVARAKARFPDLRLSLFGTIAIA